MWTMCLKDLIKYYTCLVDMKGKIRVFARWRPLSEKEKSENQKSILSALDEFTLEHPWKDDKPKQFQFDRVFDEHSTQTDIFEDTKVFGGRCSMCFYQFIQQNCGMP